MQSEILNERATNIVTKNNKMEDFEKLFFLNNFLEVECLTSENRHKKNTRTKLTKTNV